MKNLFLFAILLMTMPALWGQTVKPTNKPPVAKQPQNLCKNLQDSASYSVGMSVANFYKMQGIKSLNSAIVAKAINDLLAGKPSLFDEPTANLVMNKYGEQIQAEKSKPEIEAGNKFLAKNRLRAGVKTTPSGMQYEVITEGTGTRPAATDSVTCNYKGNLLNGFEFDNSYKRGQPITFYLGRVIAGWTEGLQYMTVGSKYKFYIPYQLGYGLFGQGSIPGGALLIFEVELLDVKSHTQ